MTMTAFPGSYGFPLSPYFGGLPIVTSGSNRTLDAAGESVTAIGRLYLSSGPGTSATFDTSGKLHYIPSTSTFANGSSNLRIGIQDVGATGIEDGTFDVYADLVGGVDALTAADVNSMPMESGTKSLTHGDLVAVSIELTARGGVDSVVFVTRTGPPGGNLPYITVDSTGTPAKVTSQFLPITIEFGNGVVGWLGPNTHAFALETASNFNVATSPDEFALILTPTHTLKVAGLFAIPTLSAAARDFEMGVYSDPLGTPAIVGSALTGDADFSGLGNVYWEGMYTSELTLSAGAAYAVAFRPTTVSNVTFSRMAFNAGNANLRKATPLGTNWYQASRTNQTGAFGSTDDTLLPIFGLLISGIDDGAGGGGGGTVVVPQLNPRFGIGMS